METVQLKVEGMSCGSCVTSVTRALLKVPEVSAVQIDLSRGVAKVTTQGAAADSVPAMITAIGAAGYAAGPLQGKPSAVARTKCKTEDPMCGCGQGGGRQGAGGCCAGR